MTDALSRITERHEIRGHVEVIGGNSAGASNDDAAAAAWVIAELVAQGVLAICNLAETVDARGASIGAAIREPED